MLKKLVEVHPRGGKKQSDSDSESEGKKLLPVFETELSICEFS